MDVDHELVSCKMVDDYGLYQADTKGKSWGGKVAKWFLRGFALLNANFLNVQFHTIFGLSMVQSSLHHPYQGLMMRITYSRSM